MRLWSIHPKYLDTKGLIACWREGLLARKVILGETRGYRNHPQLIRFKNSRNPIAAIDSFLSVLFSEAKSRGYKFDSSKINTNVKTEKIPVTQGQLEYEIEHLKHKLALRDISYYNRIKEVSDIIPNDIFEIHPGNIEDWEIINPR